MQYSRRLALIHLKWAPVVGATAMIALGAMKPPDGRGGGGGKGGDPPAAVTDLAVTSITHDSITIEWTASGNNGTEGTAAAYEIHYLLDEPITDANWDDANLTYTEPAPQASGSAESFTIHRLSGNQTYDIAMKVINGGGSASDLSNQVAAVTSVATPGQWDPDLVTQTSGSDRSDFDIGPVDGHPSVAYLDWNNQTLWFAHFDGAVWNSEIMLPAAGLPTVGLQHDLLGRPTVTFSGSGSTGLFFGTRDIGGWSFETVDSGSVDSDTHRPVYDSAGNPSVVYQTQVVTGKGKNRTTTSTLHFAVRVGGSWQRETIDASNANHAMHASLAYDLGGNAAVSYTWEGTDDVRELRLAVRTGPGVWTTDTTQSFPTATPSDTSLAFDPVTGLPMIALRARMDFSNQNWTLHAVWFDGVAWQIDLVDPVGTNANEVNVLFDATSAPVIAYRNFDDVRIEVLMARFKGAAWDIEVVEDNLDVNLDLSLNKVRFRFDATNDPWILFGVSHGPNGTPNTDELILTRKIGN